MLPATPAVTVFPMTARFTMWQPFLHPIRSRFLHRADGPANIVRKDREVTNVKPVPVGETLPCAAALFTQNTASSNQISGRKGTAMS